MVETLLEVLGQRRDKLKRLARGWGGQRETVGVQKLSLQSYERCTAIRSISRQRMSCRREMDTDLVRASGVEPGFEERKAGQVLQDVIGGGRAARC